AAPTLFVRCCALAGLRFAPEIIERYEAVHIIRGYRPAERAACKVFRNLPRACGLTGFLGIAGEDQRTAPRFRKTSGVVRAEDFDAVAKNRHAAVAGTEPESANAIESGGDVLVGLDVGTVAEGYNDVTHAGLDLYRNFREARHDLRPAGRSLVIDDSLIGRSADRFAKHDLAVDHDDQRAFVFQRRGIEAQTEVEDVDAVLAV